MRAPSNIIGHMLVAALGANLGKALDKDQIVEFIKSRIEDPENPDLSTVLLMPFVESFDEVSSKLLVEGIIGVEHSAEHGLRWWLLGPATKENIAEKLDRTSDFFKRGEVHL